MSCPFILLCITLTNDVECLFRCFFAIYIFSMVKYLFKFLPIFKLNHFLLSFESFKNICYRLRCFGWIWFANVFPSFWPRDMVCHCCMSYWGLEMSSFQPGENKAVTLSLFSFWSEEPEAWGLWANDLLTISLKLYNSIGFSINNIKVTMPYFSKGTVTLISQIRKAKEILIFPVSHKDMAENTFSICS